MKYIIALVVAAACLFLFQAEAKASCSCEATENLEFFCASTTLPECTDGVCEDPEACCAFCAGGGGAPSCSACEINDCQALLATENVAIEDDEMGGCSTGSSRSHWPMAMVLLGLLLSWRSRHQSQDFQDLANHT